MYAAERKITLNVKKEKSEQRFCSLSFFFLFPLSLNYFDLCSYEAYVYESKIGFVDDDELAFTQCNNCNHSFYALRSNSNKINTWLFIIATVYRVQMAGNGCGCFFLFFFFFFSSVFVLLYSEFRFE